MIHTSLNPRRLTRAAMVALAALLGSCGLASSYPSPEQILAACQVKRGNCLVIGPGSSRLAAELYTQGGLRTYAIEPDQVSLQAGRRHVADLGIYGKVTVHCRHQEQMGFPPLHFSILVLNLIDQDVSEETLSMMYRLLRPGGKAVLSIGADKAPQWKKLMTSVGLSESDISEMPGGQDLVYLRPGPDPAQDWRSWFGGPFHECAANCPQFKPPLVEVWSWRTTTSARHNWIVPIVGDGVVVYHEWQFGYINAHDAYTGQLLWTHSSGYPDAAGVHKRLWMSVPAVAGGTTLVATSLEELTCIDLYTGQTLWTKPIPADIDWDQEPGAQSLRHISVYDGKYYLIVHREKAVCFDPKTGNETVIKPLLPYRSYARVGQYVFYPERWDYSHRPMTWTVKKEGQDEALYTFDSSGRPRACIANPEGLLLCKGWDGYSALELHTGKRLWTGPSMPYTCGSASYAGGYAWSTASGATYCIDVDDGSIPWMIRNSNSCVPPTIANGILYTMSNNSLRLRAFASANLLKLPARRKN